MRYKSGNFADKHLSVPLQFKDLSDTDPPGTIEAIASVFNNKDFAGEVVMPGAFKNSLVKRLPRFAWAHNWERIVGKTVEAIELLPGDPRLPVDLMNLGGLYVKGKFNLNTTDGKDAYEHLLAGDVNEFSIGYKIIKAHRVTEEGNDAEVDMFDLLFGFGGKSTLFLDELDLLEWSPVLAGMNERTAVIGIKSDGPIVDLIDQAAQACGILLGQTRVYAESRTKEGRTFSGPNYAKLEGFADRLLEMSTELRDLLESAAPKSADKPAEEGKEGEPSLIVQIDKARAAKILGDTQATLASMNRLRYGY